MPQKILEGKKIITRLLASNRHGLGGRAAGETAGCGAERSDLTLTFGPKADCEFPRFQSGDGAGQ